MDVTIQVSDTTGKEIAKYSFDDGYSAPTISASLQANQTVYIDINTGSEDYFVGDVYISAEITTPITLDNPVQTYLRYCETQVFTFAPDVDGKYLFFVEYDGEEGDVDAELYVDGEYVDYYEPVTLEKGQSVRLVTSGEYVSFTVAVREYQESEYE